MNYSVKYLLNHPEKLREALEPNKEYHILNLGAGVQSTTVYLLNMEGKINPKIDLAIFADTQDEPKAVYQHLEWLQSLNDIPIIIASLGSLGNDLKNGRLPSRKSASSLPLFTKAKDGTFGILRRQCTSDYKINVIHKAMREQVLGLKYRQRWPKKINLVQYFGISSDEARRSINSAKSAKNFHNSQARFPLLEINWTRANCMKYLQEKVPHTVPRSACVYCPYHSDTEWYRIKTEDPESWQRVLEVDSIIRDKTAVLNKHMKSELFLHKECKPINEIDFIELMKKDKSGPKFTQECEGMCGL